MPFAPRKTLILAFSFLVGVMISSALVLGREARNNPFRSAEDLERITTYPVIGQLPLLPIRRRRDALGYLADKPTSAAAEAAGAGALRAGGMGRAGAAGGDAAGVRPQR